MNQKCVFIMRTTVCCCCKEQKHQPPEERSRRRSGLSSWLKLHAEAPRSASQQWLPAASGSIVRPSPVIWVHLKQKRSSDPQSEAYSNDFVKPGKPANRCTGAGPPGDRTGQSQRGIWEIEFWAYPDWLVRRSPSFLFAELREVSGFLQECCLTVCEAWRSCFNVL